jgi:hypothetical protein
MGGETHAPGTKDGPLVYNAEDCSKYFAVRHALAIKVVMKDRIAAGRGPGISELEDGRSRRAGKSVAAVMVRE